VQFAKYKWHFFSQMALMGVQKSKCVMQVGLKLKLFVLFLLRGSFHENQISVNNILLFQKQKRSNTRKYKLFQMETLLRVLF